MSAIAREFRMMSRVLRDVVYEYDCVGADLTALIDNPTQKNDRLISYSSDIHLERRVDLEYLLSPSSIFGAIDDCCF
jgi:hypothetical protein